MMKQIIILAWCSNYSLIEHITYNIHRWISMNIDETRNIQQWNDEYRRDDEHMFQGDYFSSKNLEPIKLISFTNVSGWLYGTYNYEYRWDDETNHNSRLMLELFFDWTYNIQHTPMNIDENGTYNIKHKIYTDEYRWNKEHTTISFINISGWFLFLLRTWNLLNWSVLPMFH